MIVESDNKTRTAAGLSEECPPTAQRRRTRTSYNEPRTMRLSTSKSSERSGRSVLRKCCQGGRSGCRVRALCDLIEDDDRWTMVVVLGVVDRALVVVAVLSARRDRLVCEPHPLCHRQETMDRQRGCEKGRQYTLSET